MNDATDAYLAAKNGVSSAEDMPTVDGLMASLETLVVDLARRVERLEDLAIREDSK